MMTRASWLTTCLFGAGLFAGQEPAHHEIPRAERIDHLREERRNEYLKESEAALAEAVPAPPWVQDALWYYIDVPRFHDGESSNNSKAMPPWGVKRSFGTYIAATGYGGDLQGVRKRLPYLKNLGVNALILDNVFPAYVNLENRRANLLRTLHVRDDVAVADSRVKVTGETLDPQTWKFTASDQLLLDVVAEAQAQGFRVVVEYPHPTNGSGSLGPPLYFYDYSDLVMNMNARWLRKPSDGARTKGLDGWSTANRYSEASKIFAWWRNRIKAVHPQASLIGLNQIMLPDDPLRPSVHADALVYTEPVDCTIRLFRKQTSYTPGALGREIADARQRKIKALLEIPGETGDPRIFNGLTPIEPENGRPRPVVATSVVTSDIVERWRLAMTFQLLQANDYAIPFGEEVGMVHEGPPWHPEPMWWNDLPNPESRKPTYRGDFYALVQMLNGFRARLAPLRRGDFKMVLADEEKKLLAFARTLPDDQVIAVMNYGEAKQPVSLTVGKPGDLVPVLSPQLKPMPMARKGQPPPPEPDPANVPELRVGAQREYVKPDGTIDFWVDPMGIRLVLLGHSAREAGRKTP